RPQFNAMPPASDEERLREAHPIRRAGSEAVVIEVIARVVDHAAALAVAIADNQVAARATLQQEREVFTTGQRLHVGDQTVFAEPVEGDLPCETGHLRIVDEHRRTSLIVNMRTRA